MDVFAHTLWTNVVFYKKLKQERMQRFIAMFFGVFPDIISFVPVFIYSFIAQKGFLELVGTDNWTVRFAEKSYNYSHSIVIFSLVFILLIIFRKFVFKCKSVIYWPIFGWTLHIFIDIFTHKNFYETPFLFPLSGYKFSHGVSWAHPVFMIVNYAALVAVYLIWFLFLRKKNLKNVV